MLRSSGVLSPDLFPEAGLPSLLPDELFYSWCARFHRLAGIVDTKRTANLLFGDVGARNRHDFPSNLGYFDEATCRHFGDIDGLLCRTQFAFHRPFLDRIAETNIKTSMVVGKAGLAQKQLGLSKSGWHVPAPLKACPICMAQDEAQHHIAYWHIEHQWPSVRICREHKEPLFIACDGVHERHARGWWLPHDLPVSSWIYPPNLSSENKITLLDLAQWTADLLCVEGFTLSGEVLRFCYQLRAKELGWIAMDGSVRFQQLGNAFGEKYRGLSDLAGWEFIRDAHSEKTGFLKLLLRKYGKQRHPLKQILMLNFLYENTEAFLQNYARVSEIYTRDGADEIDFLLKDKQVTIKKLVEVDGWSVNAAAFWVGVTPAMAVRYAKRSGIKYKRRPRVLTEEKEVSLKKLLLAGEDPHHIAAELGMSVKYIRAYLGEHFELRNVHWIALTNRVRECKRAHFLEVLDQSPGVPIKRIRRIPGNGFEWLYRNDLDWLRGHLPKIWSR